MSVTAAAPTRAASRGRGPKRARSAWDRVRRWATTIALAAVSVLALFTVVIPFVMGAETFTVLTGSMRPALEPGSLVAVKERDVADIRAGDVVTYQLRPGEPTMVTHRVVGLTRGADGETMLITRGDANSADDAPVLPVQVRGVMVYALPWFGYPNLILSGTTRSTLVIALGAIVIVYGFVILGVDLLRGRSRRRRGPATLVVLGVAAALSASVVAPGPPAAAADAPPPGTLQLSTDGRTWTSAGDLEVFPDAGAVAPGAGIADSLWVRNASSDPARVGLVLTWAPADPAVEGDRVLAAALRAQADDELVTNGEVWDAGVLSPGASREIRLTIDLEPASGNESRSAQGALATTVRLTQAVDGASDRGGVLPPTGQRMLLGAALVAGGLVLAGAAVRGLSRGRAR